MLSPFHAIGHMGKARVLLQGVLLSKPLALFGLRIKTVVHIRGIVQIQIVWTGHKYRAKQREGAIS